jgi:hypothetical protein
MRIFWHHNLGSKDLTESVPFRALNARALKAEHETIVVPEFSSTTILAVFMAVTILAAALTKKNPTKRLD